MEKTEAASRLKKAGYQVQMDSSVVTVLLTKKANISGEIKKIKSFLKEIGYEASFGIKQIKSMAKEEESLETEEEWEEGTQEEEKEIAVLEQFSLEDFGIS